MENLPDIKNLLFTTYENAGVAYSDVMSVPRGHTIENGEKQI